MQQRLQAAKEANADARYLQLSLRFLLRSAPQSFLAPKLAKANFFDFRAPQGRSSVQSHDRDLLKGRWQP